MNYPQVHLAEIARPISRPVAVVPGTAYRTLGVKWWGEGAYERETIDGSQTAARTLSIVREDDLIINKIWVRHGSTAIVPATVDGCSASGEFPTFELDRSRVLPRWLHWQTKTQDFWAKCDHLSRGTSGKNRIKPELFLTIPIPLPPLAEQRRLIARIDTLAAKVAEARGLRQQASEETEAVLAAHLNTQFGNPYAKTVGTLSIDRFVQLSDVVTDVADGPHVTPHYVEAGIPFVTVLNITSGRVNFSGLKYITAEEHQQFQRRARAEKGDVLISKDGTIGVPCYVDTDREFSFFVSVALIKPYREKLDGQFLTWAFRAPYLQDKIRERSRGDMIRHLVLREIRNLIVPLPPLPEQRRIVAHLDALQAKVDALKALQAATAAELDALLPAILDRAFKGGL